MKPDPDWWKTIFDDVYLLTDARSVCDQDITRREVDLICELLPIRPEHRILDLCGGHGRHSLELCARGMNQCTLLDYSQHLVDHARTTAAAFDYPMDFVQADARSTGLPAESFDHVFIMVNSLGYIQEPGADHKILTEANRLLRPGGWLLIVSSPSQAPYESTLTPVRKAGCAATRAGRALIPLPLLESSCSPARRRSRSCR